MSGVCRRLPRLLLTLAALAPLPLFVETARAQGNSPANDDQLSFIVGKTPAFTADAQAGQTPPPAQGGGAPQQQPTPPPLKPGEKISRSLRSAFLSPEPYLFSAFGAGITQLREDDLPHKETDDKVADWGSRTARNFATRTTRTFFASGIYPALFKQDPRYEPSPRKGFGRRTLHAASRVLITRDDDWNLEPNYSRLAGVMTASAIANVWERSTPGHDRIGADATLNRFARSLGYEALGNIIFKEFWPDIIHLIRR